MQKRLFIVIVPLVVIALGIVGYLSYKSYSPKPSSSPVSVNTGTVNATVNLKTYTNDKYGFSFNYPPNLAVKTEQDLNINTGEDSIYLVDSALTSPELQNALVRVGVITKNPNFNSLDEYLESLKNARSGTVSDFDPTNPQPVKLDVSNVNGHDSVEIYSQSTDSEGRNYISREVTLQESSNLLITITAIERDNKPEVASAFNYVVSTIAFANK
jgi:hypothetical protein